MIKHLEPIKKRRKYYEENLQIVDEILINGINKARKNAKEVVDKIKKSMKTDYCDN